MPKNVGNSKPRRPHTKLVAAAGEDQVDSVARDALEVVGQAGDRSEVRSLPVGENRLVLELRPVDLSGQPTQRMPRIKLRRQIGQQK